MSSNTVSEIIKGELELLEKIDGLIFTPIIVNWLSVFVVVEENALYVYPSDTSLSPIHVIRVESMHVENMNNTESGRDFCFLISNAFTVYMFSAKNKALQKLWVEKLFQLRIIRLNVLMMESQKLLQTQESVIVKLNGYVYYHENSRKSKWGRRWLELNGLNLCVYEDTDTGRQIERKMNLTCAIVSMSSIDSKINLSKSPKKIRDKDKWPTEHFMHVKASDSSSGSASSSSDVVDIYICAFTKEEKKNWETAFRVVGRGGMAPLAGCNIVANIIRSKVVEEDGKIDRHVVYEITITTNALQKNDETKDQRRTDSTSSIHKEDINNNNESSNDEDINVDDNDTGDDSSSVLFNNTEDIDIASFNNVPPATWTIYRRYSQFLQLHEMLSANFAVFNRADIPSFPKKTYHKRRSFVDSHIDDRLDGLNIYLNAILGFTSIRENGILHRFLLDSNDAISTFLTCRLDPHWQLKDDKTHVVDQVKNKMERDIKRVRAASVYRNVEADDMVELKNNDEHRKHTRVYSKGISDGTLTNEILLGGASPPSSPSLSPASLKNHDKNNNHHTSSTVTTTSNSTTKKKKVVNRNKADVNDNGDDGNCILS